MPVVDNFRLQSDWTKALRQPVLNPAHWLGLQFQPQLTVKLLAEATELCRPAIAYDVFPLTKREYDCLFAIGDSQCLDSPVVTTVFGDASEVALVLATIGPRLDERVAEYNSQGAEDCSQLLDYIGTLAVGEVGRIAYEFVEALAAAKGMKASMPLNPGTSHWPIEGQQAFFDLLPAADIGLGLTGSYLMYPRKSLSMAVGLGHNVLTADSGSSCDYCDGREICWQTD